MAIRVHAYLGGLLDRIEAGRVDGKSTFWSPPFLPECKLKRTQRHQILVYLII